jgi:hypothetical protein
LPHLGGVNELVGTVSADDADRDAALSGAPNLRLILTAQEIEANFARLAPIERPAKVVGPRGPSISAEEPNLHLVVGHPVDHGEIWLVTRVYVGVCGYDFVQPIGGVEQPISPSLERTSQVCPH